jgi:15-cis-phytoene synthase
VRVLNGGRPVRADSLFRHAGAAYAIAGLLQALPLHASRGQLYLPLDLLARHRARPEDVLAGQETDELRAALAELRSVARGHLASARERLNELPAAAWPALLPLSLSRLALARMERRGYRPFRPAAVPQWRKQWALWRAARRGLRGAF